MRNRPAPIPAILPPKCSEMPAPVPLSSAIPNAASITARPMPWCERKRLRRVAPGKNDVLDMHRFIRERLCARYGDAGRGVRILYGGSVKPANAEELLGI